MSTHEQLDDALLQWFKIQRNRGILVSGPVLQQKANFFANQLNITDFSYSASWISRFNIRHNTVSGKIGESLLVEQSDVSDWLEKYGLICERNLQMMKLSNADEEGLFFKLTPDKTLKFKGEKCTGKKWSKERITVMVAAPVSGTIHK